MRNDSLISPTDSTPYAVIPIPSSRTVGRICASMPRDIREYSIWRSDDRVHRGRPADRLRTDLGQPDRPDVAGLDHVGDRTDGLLDRHVRVEPSGTVDVDVVGAEALQRVGQEGAHGGRPGVDAIQ